MSAAEVIRNTSLDQPISKGSVIRSDYDFVGVYAGRVGMPDNPLTSLGIAWRSSEVLRLLECGIETRHPFPD